tara:strand:+ start:1690 stop:2568 length:879 start_codon:yes stop_codon:yes gene_type:complete
MHLLQFKNISKKYGSFEALKNISFSIPENSIFGILGANGSGKSTFMKILPGLIQNWTGQIFYKNQILKFNSKLLKNNFGYLIESPTFYEYLTAKQNLELFSRISLVSKNRINNVLESVNLIERMNDKVSNYSYGMKQRLGIAQALLHNPDIIILDEPNNGLDPNGINDMTKLIKELKSQGKTICLSTHNLKDVEEICTDFTIFNNGINSISTSMEIQLKNSKKWLLNVSDKDKAISRISKSNLFNVINVFNNNILIDSKSKSTIKDLNYILHDLDLYKINKDSDLISYFKND